MKIVNQDVLAVISTGAIEGNIFKIICGQLDRKMYLAVNEVLDNIGGKWNRKARGHIFSGDPTEKIEQVLLTGVTVNEKKLFQFFETPLELAKKMVYMADIKHNDILLEPSAGHGAIIDCFPKENKAIYIEINRANIDILRKKEYPYVIEGDFLEYNDKTFDKIIMNPPFTKQQDIDHVLHAYKLLNKKGKVVSIMSIGFTFRENKKSKDFRKLVENCGSYEYLDKETFKDSGTMVNTALVVLNR